MGDSFKWYANGFILFLLGLFCFWAWIEFRGYVKPLKEKWQQARKEGFKSLLEPAPLSAEFFETPTAKPETAKTGTISTSAALREFIISVERTKAEELMKPLEMDPKDAEAAAIEEKLSANAREMLKLPCPSDLRYQMAWIHAVDARGERWLEIPVEEAWDYATPGANQQPAGLEGAFDVKLFIQNGRRRELIKSTARTPEGRWRVMLFRVQDLAALRSGNNEESSSG